MGPEETRVLSVATHSYWKCFSRVGNSPRDEGSVTDVGSALSWTGMIKQVCRGQDKGEGDKHQL